MRGAATGYMTMASQARACMHGGAVRLRSALSHVIQMQTVHSHVMQMQNCQVQLGLQTVISSTRICGASIRSCAPVAFFWYNICRLSNVIAALRCSFTKSDVAQHFVETQLCLQWLGHGYRLILRIVM